MPLEPQDKVAQVGPSNWSRIDAEARTVLNHYRRTARRGDDVRESLPTIKHWLENGYSIDTLVAATDTYTEANEETEERYLRLAQNFFRPGHFEQWLTGVPDVETPAASEQLPETTRKLRDVFSKRKES